MLIQSAPPWVYLREDLTLHKGPPDFHGAPTWTLHDPARNKYFALDWIAFEVISRLHTGNAAELCEEVNHTTTLNLDESDVYVVQKFLEDNELTQRHNQTSVDWLTKKRGSQHSNIWQTLIHSYLFFRVPLFRPDDLLARLIKHTTLFYSRLFFQLTTLALLMGIWGVFRQWHTFSSTLVDTFSWDGLAGYAGALCAIKVLHELGHAMTAKRFGCRVPTMGIAFLVMLPMAYTDVTESWKLESNRKRLWIAAAGIMTELIIASWSLLLWTILPEGNTRGIAFFIATTSVAATLAINASPFMRFDGYFLTCDLLGMPNLHERSFKIAKWWLRRRLFNLQDAIPEHVSLIRQRLMVLFAFGVWIYRLIVFTGIALLVYHYFFKALGIILFAVEVWYFLAKPIVSEFKIWHERRDDIAASAGRKPGFYVFWIIVILLVVPYDFTINTQGILRPEKLFTVITAEPAQVITIPRTTGTRVNSGQVLMSMQSPELQHKIAATRIKVATLTRQVSAAGFGAGTLPQQAILREQLASAQEELNGYISQQAHLEPTAPYSGEVFSVTPDIAVGDWLPKGMRLMSMANTDSWIVDCYVEESDLGRIELGNWGRFIPESPSLASLSLSVLTIERDVTRALTDAELAATAGGHILVRQQNNALVPERAIYRVRLKVNTPSIDLYKTNLRGSVVIYGWPHSLIGEFLRGGAGTLIRELGF